MQCFNESVEIGFAKASLHVELDANSIIVKVLRNTIVMDTHLGVVYCRVHEQICAQTKSVNLFITETYQSRKLIF